MVADCRLTLAQTLPEIPHTQFLSPAQHVEDPQSRFIRKELE
jgi:hypothetical protein